MRKGHNNFIECTSHVIAPLLTCLSLSSYSYLFFLYFNFTPFASKPFQLYVYIHRRYNKNQLVSCQVRSYETMKMSWSVAVTLMVVMMVVVSTGRANVSYDGRSLMIDGERKMLFSGSIHYPRSTPDVCIFFPLFQLLNRAIQFNQIYLSIYSKYIEWYY